MRYLAMESRWSMSLVSEYSILQVCIMDTKIPTTPHTSNVSTFNTPIPRHQ
jgi:hypothetical protein